MKRNILRVVSCVLFMIAATVNGNAKIAKVEYQNHTICPGDSIVFKNGALVVKSDQEVWDTIPSLAPSKDSTIVRHKVMVYNLGTVEHLNYELEVGSTYLWEGQTITRAGEYYSKVYKSKYCDCDSLVRHLTVTDKMLADKYYVIKDTTICEGSSVVWGGIERTMTDVYREEISGIGGAKDTVNVLYLTVEKPFYKNVLLEASVFPFHYMGYDFAVPGSRDFKFKSAAGCDSIYHVTVNRKTIFDETRATFCQGESYTWERIKDGVKYSSTYSYPGTYYDYLLSKDGDRDSITYVLYLTMNNAAQTTYLHETVCEGGYVTIAGEKFSTQGVHQRKLQTINGCDSTIVLSLQVLKADTVDTVAIVEAGKTITWKGNTYSAEGVYYSTPYTNRFGCDSVVRMTLTTHAVDTIADTVSICPNTTYSWNGISASRVGTFARLENVNAGKDILYSLTVKSVLPLVSKDTAFVLCGNESIVFYGKTLNENGLYVIPATCDTVYHVQVTKAQQSIREYHAVIEKGGSYTWNFTTLDGISRKKDNIKQAGIYDTLFTNVTTGCDDLYRLHLSFKIKAETEAVICAGGTYHWDVTNQDYSESGVYHHIVRSLDNLRDSIDYTLNLTVYPTYTKRINKTICEGSSFSIAGQQFSTTGEHVISLKSINGCDSTIYLNLLVAGADITDTVAHVEAGKTFKWRGIDRTVGGIYIDTLQNAFGCDSITRLHLITHRIDTVDTLIYMCPGTSYTWKGITTSNGGATERIDTTSYFDSEHDVLYRLIATKKKLELLEKLIQICDNQPVEFMGQSFDQAGTYDLPYTCDTVYRVTVSKPSVSVREFNAVYSGTGSYTWKFQHEGVTKSYAISEAGTHVQKLDNTYGCQDTYILHLSIDNMTYHFKDSLTVCEGEAFEWQGYTNLSTQYVGQTHEYTMSYKTVVGQKDSVYTLKLTVLPKQETNLGTVYFLTFPTNYLGETILSPSNTVYKAHLTSAAGCDSIVSFVAQRKMVEDKTTAEICEGKTYTWQGHTLTSGGIYNEVEKAVDGSDSVLHILDLTVKEASKSQIIKTICEGGYYNFGGKIYSETGTYQSTFVAANGCDSIVELRLNVQPAITTVLVRERMQGDTIHWGKRILTSPTIFDSIRTSAAGCDSIVRMVVNANHLDTIRDEATICNGDKYVWLGKNYYSAGEYKDIDTLENNDVVVSILKLHVDGVTKDTIDKPFTVCQGEPVHYMDSVYTKPGTYYYPYDCNTVHRIKVTMTPTNTRITNATFDGKTPYVWKKEQNGTSADIIKNEAGTYDTLIQVLSTGCFDLYRLYLTVDTFSYHFHETQFICEGETATWQGHDYTNLAVGTHEIYKEGKTVTGYDSTYHLTLTVYPKYNAVERIEIDTFPFDYRGIRFDAAGVKELKLTSIHGCDSIVSIHAVQRTLVDHEYATICKGDVHTWHGKDYSVGGDYMIRDKSTSGDSINYILHLTVHSIPDTHINATICRGDFYTFGGVNLDKSGVYRETLTNNGCDSVVVLSLSVVDASQKVINLKVPGDSVFDWHGNHFEAGVEGTYQFDTLNIFGCDSSTVLNLTRYKEDTLRRTVTICPDSVYTWDGETYSANGTHTWVKLRPDGNSTRYILNLTVLEKVQKDLHYTICSGEEVVIGNETFTKDTSFFYHQTCDTVYHVFINRQPSMVHNYEATFTGSEPYQWTVKDNKGAIIINESYSEAGIYSKTVANETTGCNDIYRLTLAKVAPNEQSYHFDESMTVCEGETFRWRGIDRIDWSRRNVGSTSHYYDNYTTVYGKDSIYHLALTVRAISRSNSRISFCDSIQVNGDWIKKDTTIVDTLKNIYNCDSIHSTSYVKGTTIYRIEYDSIAPGEVLNWHGKTITNEGIYDDVQTGTLGCDIVYRLDVHFKQEVPSIRTRTELKTICEGDGFTWRKNKYYASGLYYDTVYVGATDEIDSIYVLNLTVNPIIRVNETVTFPRTAFPVYYRGVNFLKPGNKEVVYTSSLGCDSIINVIVNFSHSIQKESATICVGEKYPWRGKDYDAAGIYSQIITDKDGFDSITYTLDLKVKETPVTYLDSTICRGNYILFGGEKLSESGNYRDTLKHEGCDSVVVLTLHVVETQGTTEFRRRNPGDAPTTWHGQNLDTTGVYYHHYDLNGCQVTDVLVLTVNHVDTIDSVATICPGTILKWHGIEAETNGIFTSVEQQPNGDWNYYRLTASVPDMQFKDTTFTICQGESVHYLDSVYTKPGTYHYPYDCNTVHRVKVIVTPTQTHIINATFDGTTPYIWKKEQNGTSEDIIKTEAGTYDTLVAVPSGCFDLYRLYLTIDTFSYYFHETQTACEGETVNWQGKNYTNLALGTHEIYKEGKTITGRDSTYHLTLNVYPKYNIIERVEIDTFPYDYRGIRFDEPGMKELTLPSIHGCDSVISIYAVQRALVNHDYVTICKGDVHTWHGKDYSVSGDYMIRDKSTSGDSVNYFLHLTVYEIPETYINATICSGDFYTFGGKTYTVGGVYTETFKSNGCDSVVILSLNIADKDVKVLNWKVPADSVFTWHGNSIGANEEVTYQFDTINIHGCDSSTVLNVTRYKEDTLRRTITICPDSVYTWDGETHNVSGTHTWVKMRPDGNSTRYILNLTVLEKIQKEQRYTICSGEQVVIGGEVFTRDTDFFYQQTCDTVYHIFINRLPSMVHNYEGTVVEGGEAYEWIVKNDKGEEIIREQYNNAGIYTKTLPNETTGCNDIYRLTLNKVIPSEQSYYFKENLTVCEGETFQWRGIDRVDWSRQNIGTTTKYTEKYTTVYGKDSIYELSLTVRAIARTNERITFCDSIQVNGEWFKKDTTIVDTFKTATTLCDSIHTTSYVKGTTIHRMEYDSIAPGEILNWHGQSISTEGIYEDKQQSALGCDIVYRLDVHYKQEIPGIKTRTERETICEDDVFFTWWKTKERYYATGLYYDTVFVGTTDEIDSIYVLNLTVNPIIRVNETVSFPRSAFPVYYRGEKFDAPGSKEVPYTSSLGCDSIINVIVNYSHSIQKESATICAGEQYLWRDKYYNATGFYTQTIKDAGGYDSITYSLDLKVKETPVTYIDSTICRGNYVVFGGQQLSESGTYRDTLKHEGCDSVVVLTLHFVESQGTTEFRRRNPGDAPITWHGQNVDTTGVYYYHYDKNGCQITDVLVLTVNRVDTIDSIATICPGETLKWHGIEAQTNGTFTNPEEQPNGDWKYYRLELTVQEKVTLDTTLSICSGETVTFNGIKYSKAGVYDDPYNNCDTAYRVHIQVRASQVYETIASMNGTEAGYTWTFWRDGHQVKDSLFTEPGTYEYTTPNVTTGCNDVWRLILSKDENSYHFEDTRTICEGDPFEWQGLRNLSSVVGTNTYVLEYKTRTGKDSIYTLHLTVKPIVRSSRSEYFCGTYVWRGVEYKSSAVVYDTLTSVQHGCDSIVEIRLNKAQAFYDKQETTIMEGEILTWHGQNISSEGIYRDPYTTIHGCDSIYELKVNVDPAPVVTPTYSLVTSICDGDSIEWRGSWYKSSGIYKDSIFNAAARIEENLTEVYVLNLTVWPSYTDTIVRHIYICSDEGSYRYYNRTITESTVIDTTFQTIHGCDSVERVYFHFSDGTFSSDTIKRYDNQEPYIWPVRPDTSYSNSGTYYYTEQLAGKCANEHELVLIVYPTFLYEADTTICVTNAPFDWKVNGKTIASGLSHAAGEKKTYEYKYETIHGADSIYRLNLQIDPVPTRTETYQMCESEELYLYGKYYYSSEMKTDSVYRDTIFRSAPDNMCDSIILIEVTNRSVQRHIETRVLADGETLPVIWHGKEVNHFGLTADTIPASDPNECYRLEYINLVEEKRTVDSICILDTPYVAWRGKDLSETRLYWDTTYDATGLMTRIYSLDLKVQEVPKRTEVYYLCEGETKSIYGKTYGTYPYHVVDSIYLDTVNGGHGPSKCDTLVYVKVHLVAAKTSTKTVILEDGQSFYWGGSDGKKFLINNGGEYRDTIANVGLGGCDSISILNVIAEVYMPAERCVLDTPYIWSQNGEKYYASGIYHDTIFTDSYKTQIKEYYTLDLNIIPVKDSTLELRGCLPGGVTWNDHIYYNDTTFDDTIRCEALYHVNIVVRRIDTISIDTTLCEHELPLVIGRAKKDTIWEEGTYRHRDTTLFGCDSIVDVKLTIIPKLTRNDSTFVCSDFFKDGQSVWLGDTVHPAFDPTRSRLNEWQGKWKGVAYNNDTIVWNCDKSYFHHIIVRPSQEVVKDTVIYICPEDTIMFRAIHPENHWDDSTYFTKDTLYQEHVPMVNKWTDTKHKYTYYNDAYVCDSITNWYVKVLDIRDKDTTAHRIIGDSIKWGNRWYHYTGDYDSIAQSVDTNVLGEHCTYIYTLHLIMDTVYHYRDTIDLCTPKNKTHTYIWEETGHEQAFTIQVNKDTIGCHFIDSLKSHEGRDSIYDLVVNYSMFRDTLLFDTICEDTKMRFDSVGLERWISKAGRYYDTLTAVNGCDSFITLQLYVRPRILPVVKHVTITDRQLPYAWKHTWYNQATKKDSTYIDSLYVGGAYQYLMPSIHGCDSIDSLYLTIHQTHDFYDTIDVCAPTNTTLTHVWENGGYKQTFNTPATDKIEEYADTLKTFYPLDSIFYLRVNYHRTYETHVYDTICAGDSAYISTYKSGTPKRFYKHTGIYHDTVQTVYGCDSVITLHLQVWPKSPTYHRQADINVNDTPFIWTHTWVEAGTLKRDTDSIYVAGDYRRILQNIHGCDSIDSLTLRIHPNYLFKDSITICSNETPYIWYGPDSTVYKTDIYSTGLYEQKWRTANNYGDSIRARYITVLPVKDSTIIATICEGEVYLFNGEAITKSGIYHDTVVAKNGCDSIITLNIAINKPYYNYIEKHIVEGDSVVMNGKAFKNDTICTFKGTTPQGCDSIVDLKVVVHPMVDTVVTVCANDLPYMWVNKWKPEVVTPLYAAGLYRNDSMYVDGKQMFYGLKLIVNQPSDSTIIATICEGEVYLFNGEAITKSGIYHDTVVAKNGCDSIITLNIAINKPYYNYIEKHIVEGDSVVMNGKAFKNDTICTFKGTTPQGCDSIVDLKVVVHPMVDTVVTVCANDLPYMWVNKWKPEVVTPLYAAGLYRNDSMYVDGKQMFYGLKLIVTQPSDSTIIATICEGEVYLFNGEAITKSGLYHDTVVAKNGCDSIITLNITINKPYYNYIEKHIVEGDSVVMNGKTFKNDTICTFKGTTPQGCDSIVDLKVVVHPMVDTVVTVCANDLPYMWVNKWKPEVVTPLYAGGLYRNDSMYVDGKQMFYGLKLIVNQPSDSTIIATICEGEVYLFNGEAITKSGIYHDTVVAKNGCDSIITLNIAINKPYYNYVEKHIVEGDSVMMNGKAFKNDTICTFKGTTPQGCDSIVDLKVVVHPLVDTVVTVCSHDLPYMWVNKWDPTKVTPIYAAGLYRNDSVYVDGKQMFYGLKLIVTQPSDSTIVTTICEGDFYFFDGKELTESGIYQQHLLATNGCDSTVTLNLIVNKPYYNFVEKHIVEGDSVVMNGKAFKNDTICTFKGTTPQGCDSIVDLKVVVHPLIDTVVTVCSHDLPYMWANKWDPTKVTPIYAAGLYRNDSVYVDGKQMFYGMRLIVTQPSDSTIVTTICEGDFYFFDGKELTESGIYQQHLLATNGCDSTVTLNLIVNKPYYNFVEKHIVEGDSVVMNGKAFKNDTICTFKGTTPQGCDSIVDLKVVVHPLIDTVVTVCSHDLPYMWVNKWDPTKVTPIYAAGLYRNDSVYVDGKQMFYGLQLIVKEVSDTIIRDTICEGDTKWFGGQNLTTAGRYSYSIGNESGCDSIVTLILTVGQRYYRSIDKTIYEGDTVEYYGKKYWRTGIYQIVNTTTQWGCDSIVELNLSVVRLYDESINICYDELPYLWRLRSDTTQVKELYKTGIYRDTVMQDGKMAIYGLMLNVLPITYDTIRASVCEGDAFTFAKQEYTEPGKYTKTFKNINGCDSIVTLILNVNRRYHTILDRTIFQGDTVHFDNKVFTTTGIYQKYDTTVFGCDSLTELRLTVNRVYDDSVSLCFSELPYRWRLKSDTSKVMEIYESGLYRDTITQTDGRKVVTGLMVKVLPLAITEQSLVFCEGDSVIYRNTTYKTNGTFYDTIRMTTGCDSIIKINVTVHPTYEYFDVVNISDKEIPYDFYGRKLTQTGYYENMETDKLTGCNRIHHLNLTVHKTYHFEDSVHLCMPDTLLWHNQIITTSGNYHDSLYTVYGYDSVYHLHVGAHSIAYGYEKYELGKGEVIELEDTVIRTTGDFWFTHKTAYGCDSIVHVYVIPKSTREFSWNREICQGSYVDFFGKKLTRSGNYHWESEDKDSIVNLTLTVKAVPVNEERVVITDKQVESGSYVHKGQLYNGLKVGSNLFSDTLIAANGCDSISRFIILVTTHYSDWLPIPICPGSEVKIDDQVITKAGLYTFLRLSKTSGVQDSLLRVEVYDAPAYDLPAETRVICQGDTVRYAGQEFTRGGHYDIPLKTKEGCDSLMHLDLTVYPTYHIIEHAVITDYEGYYWNGMTYTDTTTTDGYGKYSMDIDRSWSTINDCDSTHTLRLTVVETKRYHTDDTICAGQDYVWRGDTIRIDGSYVDTIRRLETYYSAIYSLNLVTVRPTVITSTRTSGDICADSEGFDVSFSYSGQKPAVYSIYFDVAAKRAGFKDVINERFEENMLAHVSLPTYTLLCYETHPYYVRPDNYSMRLVLDNGVCGTSRSDSITFQIKYPSWIIEQNWSDVVAPLSSEYNGGFEFSNTEWYINGVLSPTNGLGYLHNRELQPGDQVHMVATRRGENYSIESCPITIEAPVPDTYVTPVIVYPTQAPRHAPVVTIEAQQNGDFDIYSTTGMHLGTGKIIEGKTQVTLPPVRGIYFIRTTQGESKAQVHKVILY